MRKLSEIFRSLRPLPVCGTIKPKFVRALFYLEQHKLAFCVVVGCLAVSSRVQGVFVNNVPIELPESARVPLPVDKEPLAPHSGFRNLFVLSQWLHKCLRHVHTEVIPTWKRQFSTRFLLRRISRRGSTSFGAEIEKQRRATASGGTSWKSCLRSGESRLKGKPARRRRESRAPQKALKQQDRRENCESSRKASPSFTQRRESGAHGFLCRCKGFSEESAKISRMREYKIVILGSGGVGEW